ncbi:tyrosine-type recombinase/integrase [Pseudomonas coronafaciens]|uniref:Tyrosine-type recombinase/integrase n=1 Tax=Pseudomonas coronafaciens pv. coronafaciens TaxID=235275 RepID=A0AAE6ULR3_9PSED|nr:tyrosine-type recombinase/integrase [Pseudomonas coronafaciens]QGT80621.1 tyrosine-type recombinase/integrase [Pseudomonas coronafaciens pv. coronafaciens]
MTNDILEAPSFAAITDQPRDVRGLSNSERDKLIIKANQVDGHWVIISRYGDDVWYLTGFPKNVPMSNRRIVFDSVPPVFRHVVKAIFYRYLTRGREVTNRPRGATITRFFRNLSPFLQYLDALQLRQLGSVTPMIAATYAKACKAHLQASNGKPLSASGLHARYQAVEALYELSQYTEDKLPQHPWPNTSAKAMAGRIGIACGGLTPLIPDDVFCILFEEAHEHLGRGERLLDLRDDLDRIASKGRVQTTFDVLRSKNQHLRKMDWEGGLRTFKRSLLDLRTACYIVLASTTGCRNHELANLQSGAHLSTEDDDGTVYHWMRSKSEKTDEGTHDWMIPKIAVRAIRVMERWATPYQAMISNEILKRRLINPQDPQITEARAHRNSLFLGINSNGGNQARTLCNRTWDGMLKAFVKGSGLRWNLTSHQFRRKFANYAAHSRFGDLRYLKKHYAHWSLDMTLGYAMDEKWGQHLDLELYTEVQDELEDIKLGIIDSWIGDESLAGGYGRAIKEWQREPENLLIFKDRTSMLKSISESTAIRSNGHAWCTADNDGCVGNTIERTRCGGGCHHSVIGSTHAPIYQRLYDDLKGLLLCKDIGEGGRQRVERDLNRCRDVLTQLGMPPEDLIA